MLNVARIVFFAFAALLIVGGIMGYVEKKSVMSLGAGIVCGGMSVAAGVLIMTNPKLALGLGIAAAVVRKIFPGITVVVASVIALGVGVAALMETRK